MTGQRNRVAMAQSAAPPAQPVDASAALLASLAAGLATGLGGLAVCALRRAPGDEILAASLAFAAGVMAAVSVGDVLAPLLWEAKDAREAGATLLYALAGAALVLVARAFLPDEDHVMQQVWQAPERDAAQPPAAARSPLSPSDEELGFGGEWGGADGREDEEKRGKARKNAWRLAVLMVMVLTAHNAPEGVAVAVGTLGGRGGGGQGEEGAGPSPWTAERGVVLTLAVGLHNVAEGLAVAVPVLMATESHAQALAASLVSGLSEPLAALLTLPWVAHVGSDPGLLRSILALVAGVMLCVVCVELVPEAYQFALASESQRREALHKRKDDGAASEPYSCALSQPVQAALRYVGPGLFSGVALLSSVLYMAQAPPGVLP